MHYADKQRYKNMNTTTIKVLQIQLSDEMYDKVNAGEFVPEFMLKRDMGFDGSERWKPENINAYTHVADVVVEERDEEAMLNDAMAKTQDLSNYGETVHPILPKRKVVIDGKEHEFNNMETPSSGTVFIVNGNYYITEFVGFKKVTVSQ